ncbi:MAG: fatty acid desaturase-domain-containing protein [Benniella sp.]|nr:MAG: fatty acid desaturase-domain-containing protein [Benniella sp.]
MSSSVSEIHDDVVVVDVDQILLSPAKAAEKAGVSPGKVKRLSLITSEDLKTPTIAVPTIAVAAGSLAVWGSVLYYGAYKRKVSPLLTFPIMTAACFAAFTPVHDGTHSSIAKGPYKKLINNVVGYLSGIPLNLPFGVYRQLHLMHHRYTNTDKDPDVWDARGPMVLRFFKWFFPDYFWIKSALTGEVKDAKLLDAALFYLAMIWMVRKMSNKGLAVLKYWILPQRTAYWLLVWLFAYVPHRPDGEHQFNATDNIYKMTNVTGGILNSDGFNLAIPLLNQHLHNIHHLYPQLPFTHYGKIWSKYKNELIAAGTEIHPVYSSKQDWKWDEGLDGRKRK